MTEVLKMYTEQLTRYCLQCMSADRDTAAQYYISFGF